MPFVSLKWPTASKRDIGMIEHILSKIAEEDHFFKTLLDFSNMFKAGLISELEYARRKKEKEEEARTNMAGGRAMTDTTRRQLESRAPLQ
ncbi:unnamed protein product [Prunus armeniaca]|uniref:Uncharacterized protein n=1 Tax=Prunus armeniaca TaxID=36596 RepID=A0A6J5VES2_PRUAR|nr:unnamed protein product [Prunus armeniaca]